MIKGFANVGCITQEGKSGHTAQILILCDQQKVIEAVPLLQKMGMMNPDISQTALNMMPGAIASSFMMEAASGMVDPYYQSHSADVTAWEGDLVVANNFGHMRRMPIFGFRFNRALDHRVNWGNMNFQRLEKIAPGFHFFPGVSSLLDGSD